MDAPDKDAVISRVKARLHEVGTNGLTLGDVVKEEAIAIGAGHDSFDLYIDIGDIDPLIHWNMHPIVQMFLRPPVGGSYSAAALDEINPAIGFRYYASKMTVAWPDWIFQPDLTIRLRTSFISEDNTWDTALKMDPATLKIYTRPHTKAELEAAGMWPV